MEFDFELYLIESLKRFVREAIIYSKMSTSRCLMRKNYLLQLLIYKELLQK